MIGVPFNRSVDAEVNLNLIGLLYMAATRLRLSPRRQVLWIHTRQDNKALPIALRPMCSVSLLNERQIPCSTDVSIRPSDYVWCVVLRTK